MTSHLESTRDGEEERKEQLKISFKYVTDSPQGVNTIFGGDTNLRDHEVIFVLTLLYFAQYNR